MSDSGQTAATKWVQIFKAVFVQVALSFPMARRLCHNASVADGRTIDADDVSFHIWRKIYSLIVLHQKEAAQVGQPVCFDLEIIQRAGCSDEARQLLFVHVTCEPGRPPDYVDYSGQDNGSIVPLAIYEAPVTS